MGQQGPIDSKKGLADNHSADDIDAIEEFCLDVELDEIEYDTWCDHHTSLDLVYTLCIKSQCAAEGCTRIIQISRSVSKLVDDWVVCRREKFQQVVEIPAGAKDGLQIKISGCGDFNASHKGDLLVTIRIENKK